VTRGIPTIGDVEGARRLAAERPLAFGAIALYAIARFVPFARARVGMVLDSFDYLELARHTSWLGLLAARRPPVYLLVLRVLGENRQLVTWLQLLVGTVAWAWLAVATARNLRTGAGRAVGFSAILVLGSSLEVVQWDRLIGTESFSISLGVMVVAAVLWWWARWSVAGVALVSVLIALWALVRDANAVVAGTSGALVIVVVLVRRTGALRPLSVVGVVAVIVASGAVVSSNLGERWRQPIQNIVTFRVLPSPERTNYFLRRGLPVSPVEARRLTGRCVNPVGAFMCEKVTDPEFYEWIDRRARATYARSWFAFPATTLWEPLAHLRRMTGIRVPVADIAGTHLRAPYADAVERLVFPRSPRVLLAWLLLLVVGLGVLGSRVARSLLVVAVGLIALTYVHLWAVWTGDAVEPERHGLSAAVQLQLGLWLLSAGLLDAWLLTFRSRRRGDCRSVADAGSPGVGDTALAFTNIG